MIKNRVYLGVFWILATLFVSFVSPSQAAEEIEFKTLDGKTVQLSDYQGKWVVVNYWATWCPPCLVEMPELSFFHEAHKNKDAIVLGVNYEQASVKKVQAFLEEQMIKFPVVRPTGVIDNKTTPFGPLRGLPTTYMVSPSGEVIAARTGGVNQQMLEDFLEKYGHLK